MSQRGVLVGVQEYLVNSAIVDITDTNCKARPDGRPTAMMGDTFYAIHLTENQMDQGDHDIFEERFGFAVTVTKRLQAIPDVEIMDGDFPVALGWLENETQLSNLCKSVLMVIGTNNWALANGCLANTLSLGAVPADIGVYLDDSIVVSPPRPLNRDSKIQFNRADWHHGWDRQDIDTRHDGYVSISQSVYFSNMVFSHKMKDRCP